jgi:hypothetical protein
MKQNVQPTRVLQHGLLAMVGKNIQDGGNYMSYEINQEVAKMKCPDSSCGKNVKVVVESATRDLGNGHGLRMYMKHRGERAGTYFHIRIDDPRQDLMIADRLGRRLTQRLANSEARCAPSWQIIYETTE